MNARTEIAMEQLRTAAASGWAYFYILALGEVCAAVGADYSAHMKEHERIKRIDAEQRRHAQRRGR